MFIAATAAPLPFDVFGASSIVHRPRCVANLRKGRSTAAHPLGLSIAPAGGVETVYRYGNCCLTPRYRSAKLAAFERDVQVLAAGFWYHKGGFRGAMLAVDHRCTVPRKPAV